MREPTTNQEDSFFEIENSSLIKAGRLRAEADANPVDPDKVIICCIGTTVFLSADAVRSVANSIKMFRAQRLESKFESQIGLK